MHDKIKVLKEALVAVVKEQDKLDELLILEKNEVDMLLAKQFKYRKELADIVNLKEKKINDLNELIESLKSELSEWEAKKQVKNLEKT